MVKLERRTGFDASLSVSSALIRSYFVFERIRERIHFVLPCVYSLDTV